MLPEKPEAWAASLFGKCGGGARGAREKEQRSCDLLIIWLEAGAPNSALAPGSPDTVRSKESPKGKDVGLPHAGRGHPTRPLSIWNAVLAEAAGRGSSSSAKALRKAGCETVSAGGRRQPRRPVLSSRCAPGSGGEVPPPHPCPPLWPCSCPSQLLLELDRAGGRRSEREGGLWDPTGLGLTMGPTHQGTGRYLNFSETTFVHLHRTGGRR